MKVVTVDPPLAPSFLKTSPGVIDELTKQQRADSHRLLAEAVTLIERNVSGVAVLPQLVEGWPKEVILDEAERWGADLIVVGSHGYGTFKRFFLGSVSMTVAMNATCSVLIVRPSAEVDAAKGTPPASKES